MIKRLLPYPSSLREHASPMAGYARRRETPAIMGHHRIPHPTMVEKASFFSWERKPLVSSPNLSFLKVKIHFVNEKLVFLSLRARE
jgi:hypothetical protein